MLLSEDLSGSALAVLSTTADTFCASAVNYIIDHPIDELNEKDLKEMLRFANAAAYIVTTKKGAIRSMPDPEDVEEILKNN